MKPSIICLMGPTAAGKTPLAIDLTAHLPCEIISVDSAMVYRDMNIGTGKPSKEVLQKIPHHLIDILDPAQVYSAGQFTKDALHEIDRMTAQQKIPLLVGGTMMYFRALQKGIAVLPQRDVNLRAALQERGLREGWDVLHQVLSSIDAEAACRIHPQDSQRIQRALEVFMLTGKKISASQSQNNHPLSKYRVINIAIAPLERASLHKCISKRFYQMLEQGLLEEVQHLYARSDLTADLPSMHSVGYRQIRSYLSGQLSYEQMCEKTMAATRQLAKRQLTWLRSWPDLTWFDSESEYLLRDVIQHLVWMMELQ